MGEGAARRGLGRYDEVVVHGRQSCQFPGAGPFSYVHLAATLAEVGEKTKARAAVEKALQLEPAFSIGFVRSRFIGNPHENYLRSLIDGLRKAGAPA
ncbi:MAG: hypothetical protein VCE74_01235 [Alphaproteobacteria bacterium]|jgi:hypothetical protein